MLKLIVLFTLVVAGVQSLEETPASEGTVPVSDKADAEVAIDETEIPAVLAEGMRGSGDWLSGIMELREMSFADDVEKRKRLTEAHRVGLLLKSNDALLKFPELVVKYGYPVETYEVQTEDGYILQLFRIPFGKNSPIVPGVERKCVFLMHGLIDSSDDWIIMGPEVSLGYKMADAGYDVWLGNARGNTYSRRHVTKLPNETSFWDFSWDEIGRFDLPVMIDFALEKTGQKQVYYVGHSQGTTSFFVMSSMRPEYNAKIRIMYALAPIAWMTNVVSPMIRLLAPDVKGLEWITKVLGVGEFLPNSHLLEVAGGLLCKDGAITQEICENSVFIVCGFDLSEMNATMLPVIMGHSPAGSSVRQFLHYGQGVKSQDFRRYDYGMIKNLIEYGSTVPPSYDMSKITAPVALFYSTNDWLSNPKDVMTLRDKLGNMVDMYLVPNPKFNHMDYMWAIDLDKLVLNRIFETMTKY